MRARLIANPISSGVDRALVDRVAAELGRAADVEQALTQRPGHAVELAGLPGADVVVALGGDGTANEVVNGLAAGAALGVLPGGATSVFARQLGYPNDPVAAARLLAAAIAAESLKEVGLGELAGRLFTFSAGLGLDAEVTRRVGEQRAARQDGRRPSDREVLAAAAVALKADGWSLPERMTVTGPGLPLVRCSYLAVANQHPYTYLGRLPVRTTPRARADTALDATAIGTLRTRDLWRLPVYGLMWGRHARGRDRRVTYLHNVSELTVLGDGEVPVQIDGEYLGQYHQVSIRFVPGAVRAYVPVSRSARSRASTPPGR
jgi:diacylglycerol kinase family enzyme